MGKVHLRVNIRNHGARIESIPLKRLIELSGYRRTHWSYVPVVVDGVEGGWLVLEAF